MLAAAFTVQEKLAEPLAPVVSVAVTVTDEGPAVVGVPEIRPEEEIDSPAGNPVADQVRVWPLAESAPCICKLTGLPTVEVWLPGLVTVTVLAAGEFTVQEKLAEPLAPVVSVAVTVTDVGPGRRRRARRLDPKTSPSDSPAGSNPVAE